MQVKLVEVRLTGERLAMKVMDKEQCPKALRSKELHAFLQLGVSPFIVRFHSCFQTEVNHRVELQTVGKPRRAVACLYMYSTHA